MSSILVTIRITVRIQESEVRNPHSLDSWTAAFSWVHCPTPPHPTPSPIFSAPTAPPPSRLPRSLAFTARTTRHDTTCHPDSSHSSGTQLKAGNYRKLPTNFDEILWRAGLWPRDQLISLHFGDDQHHFPDTGVRSDFRITIRIREELPRCQHTQNRCPAKIIQQFYYAGVRWRSVLSEYL